MNYDLSLFDLRSLTLLNTHSTTRSTRPDTLPLAWAATGHTNMDDEIPPKQAWMDWASMDADCEMEIPDHMEAVAVGRGASMGKADSPVHSRLAYGLRSP